MTAKSQGLAAGSRLHASAIVWRAKDFCLGPVDFVQDLNAGATVISGSNSQGKSVLVQLLAGILTPDEGRVEYTGFKRPALVFQQPVMFQRSAFNNVMVALTAAGFTGNQAEARATKALSKVGLAHRANIMATTLSGGEQRRVAIARAIAASPKLLFMDEPTTFLDPENAKLIESVISDIAKSIRVVLVTHDADLAARLADRKIEIHDGKITQDTSC